MIFIYIAKPCLTCASADIFPKERAEYIESATDAEVKRQRYSSWKLLEAAVRDCFGLRMNELKFCVNAQGNWECDKLHFSLSHTDGMVAVALSERPVGVDVEGYSAFEKRCETSPEFGKSLAHRILHSGEKFSNNADLLKLWTQKESIFKCFGKEVFAPSALCAEDYPVNCFDYEGFCISVCGSFNGSEVRCFRCEERNGKYNKGERITKS